MATAAVAEKPATTPPVKAPESKPMFVARPLTEIPKREAPTNEPDMETATALLAIITGTTEIDGTSVANTASDGQKYDDVKAARGASLKAKRLLAHVEIPAGKRVKTRVWGANVENGKATGPFEWAVFLTDKAAEKTAPGTAETPASA